PGVSRVPLVQHPEGDVGEQRREDPTLRRSGLAPSELLLGKDAGLEECQDKPAHLRVTYPSAEPHHQRVMVDVVEARLDIALDGPLIREPALCFRTGLVGTQERPEVLQRSMSALTGSETVRGRIKVRLE